MTALTFDALGAFRDQDLADRAFVDRLDFHGRLVGLDLGQITWPDLTVSPSFNVPLGELALRHGGRQRGHQDIDRTCQLLPPSAVADRAWRPRRPIRVDCGSASFSRLAA